MDEIIRSWRSPFLLILLLAIVMQILYSYTESMFIIASQSQHKAFQNPIDRFCRDHDMIRTIQKKQLKKARLEVFGKDQRVYDGEQYLFYDHGFGSVEIKASLHDKIMGSLVYYRIWKNGNDNIRAHLQKFAMFCNQSKTLSVSKDSCPQVQIYRQPRNEKICVDHCYLDNSNLNSLKVFSPPDSQGNPVAVRFPFTFVREPIRRFISGYNEVEYRNHYAAKDGSAAQYSLPLYAPLGSAERFKEFVRMILKADGSKRLLHDKFSEIPHISPQIGTLLAARELEPAKTIHLYHIENFKEEFHRLADESGFSDLKKIYSSEELVTHPSSLDPLKTTEAARKFMNLALTNISDLMSVEDRQRRKAAITYTIALCRVYLVDYACAGYDLPQLCEHLQHELLSEISTYEALQEKVVEHNTIWRQWIPRPLLVAFAEVNCLFVENPLCVADILHGKDAVIDVD